MHTIPTERSRPPRAPRGGGPARQAGYGMLIALVVLVLGATYGLMRGLGEATAQSGREDHDQAVLRQARDALVARAALDDNRPGSLPCPDLDDDGVAELLAGTTCPAYLGRLPWRTLQLPDLRDGAGERLWYVLSPPFTDSSTSVINSDTQGTLVMTGLAPASNVIALVFAPGPALSVGGAPQDRSPAGQNVAANYLEDENQNAANLVYAVRPTCVTADCAGGAFNDKALAINARDLFPVVETMVAKRMQTQLREAMFKEGGTFSDKGHYQRWRDHSVDPAPPGPTMQGYFPFAAPFAQPDTSSFRGAWNTLNGLMPVAKDMPGPPVVPFVKWEIDVTSSYKPSVAEVSPGSYVLNAATACSASTDDQIVCDLRYTDNRTPTVRITGHALNVARSFVDPVQRANVAITTNATFASLPCPVPSSPTSVSNAHVTAAGVVQGSARVEVELTLPNCDDSSSGAKYVRIVVAKPPYNKKVLGGLPTWTASTAYSTDAVVKPSSGTHYYVATTGGTSGISPPAFPTDGSTVTDGSVVWKDAGPATDWFFNNDWHHVTLYSVAPAATTIAAKDASSGNPVCALPADCLDAVNTANGGPNRHLVLLLAGMPVDSTTPRPAPALARYLEGRNDWPSPAHTPANQFETYRGGLDRTRSVPGNDQLAVIAP